MYAEYFGLSEPPFSIAPDPRYLFLSAQHREALAHLAYGTAEGDGFIQLTGEIGTGKTTLVRRLLAELPEGIEIAFIFNPELSRRGLLRAVLAELGVPLPPADADRALLAERLYQQLIAAHARGRRVVLVIDEAQRLGPEVLEEIRLLTNFETDRHKLLNVMLVGQPELRETLARADLRQLAQRITARYHLGPLSLEETDEYIRHRLRLAGAPGRIFTRRAVAAVARASRGIPRLINLVCDRALMAAYARGLREVTPAIVAEAVRDVAGVRSPPRRLRTPALVGGGLVAAGLAGAAVAWWASGRVPVRPPPPAQARVQTAAPRPAPPRPQPRLRTHEPAAAGRSAVAAAPPVALPPARSAPAPATAAAGDPVMHWATASAPASGAAAATLLGLWKVAPTAADPCASAAAAGLACFREQGNLNLLRNFDRPAVVVLDAGGTDVSAVVSALDGEHITLALAPGVSRRFPIAAFERDWYGRMWLLWRPPGGQTVLQAGARGPAVAWLRSALGLPAADGKAFGAKLEAAVRGFQQRHGLAPDGIAGPETLIVLQRVRDPGSGPRLSG